MQAATLDDDGTDPPLLALRGVEKRFGGVRALRGVDLVIERSGTVHGLAGENGSGKSTLLAILSGQLQPDAGTISLQGRPVAFGSPVASLAHGVAMVSQETALAPHLTVAENILLGRRLVRRRRGIDWAATRRRAAQILDRLDFELDPQAPVETLRPDQRQMVEIARALSMDARIVILDEPTSSLTDDEVSSLFRVLERLRADGVTTIFVSHRMKELFAICDEITVLRDGLRVSRRPAAEYNAATLVADMIGSRSGRADAPRGDSGDPAHPSGLALSLRDVSVRGALDRVSLDVGQGEIVGLAGLVGAGRSELLEVIFGTRVIDAGEMQLFDRPHAPGCPRDGIRAGIGLLPADRRNQGLVLGMSVRENMLMAQACDRPRLGRPRRGAETAQVVDLMERLRTRASSPEAAVHTLSGGNQQKVALGKWLAAGSRLLLLDEPTRGVDVAAKAEIHGLLRRAAEQGASQLVSSSESSELLTLCDRVVVMFRGRAVASLSGPELTEATIARHAGGHA